MIMQYANFHCQITIFLISTLVLQAHAESITTTIPYQQRDDSWEDLYGTNDIVSDVIDESSNSNSTNRAGSNFRTLHALDSGTRLKSASRQINGVNNLTLYSVPILTIQLQNTLKSAQINLQQTYAPSDKTQQYSWNHTDWSFNVKVTNDTLQYSTISGIVGRLLKFVPDVSTTNITRTRVGVVVKDEIPIADVALLPSGSAAKFFDEDVTAINETALNGKVLVTELTPWSVSENVQVLDDHILDFLNSTSPALPPKDKRSVHDLEKEVFVSVGLMAFRITARLGRLPQRGTVLYMVGFFAFWNVILSAFTRIYWESFDRPSQEVLDLMNIYSNPYRLGQLVVRFSMYVKKEEYRNFLQYREDVLTAFNEAVKAALPRYQQPITALEGQIFAAIPVDGGTRQVFFADWNFDIAEAPIVHDEL